MLKIKSVKKLVFLTLILFTITVIGSVHAQENSSLTEYNLERWSDVIYKYCQNYDKLVAECMNCTSYPDDEICVDSIEVKNEPNIIKCKYQTSAINKANIRDYLEKIDAKYGRDLGQRSGSELLVCINDEEDKIIRFVRREQYYFGGYVLQDYYSDNITVDQSFNFSGNLIGDINNQPKFNLGNSEENQDNDKTGIFKEIFLPLILALLISIILSFIPKSKKGRIILGVVILVIVLILGIILL